MCVRARMCVYMRIRVYVRCVRACVVYLCVCVRAHTCACGYVCARAYVVRACTCEEFEGAFLLVSFLPKEGQPPKLFVLRWGLEGRFWRRFRPVPVHA